MIQRQLQLLVHLYIFQSGQFSLTEMEHADHRIIVEEAGRNGVEGQRFQACFDCLGVEAFPLHPQHPAPFPQGRDVIVIGDRRQSGGLHAFQDRQERLAGKKRAGGLGHQGAAQGEVAGGQLVEFPGIEPGQLDRLGIGQVDDDHIINFPGFLQKSIGIPVDQVYFRIIERSLIELEKDRVLLSQCRHGGVEIHQRNLLYLRIFEDLPCRQAVPAAQHQHLPPGDAQLHCRVHQRFVITLLVIAAELLVPVQVEPMVLLPFGDHDALVRALLLVDHPVDILLLLPVEHDRFGRQQQQG